MGRKPGALKGWHERLGVDFGLEQIDTDEHKRQNGGEGENPLVPPARIDNDTRQGQEERVRKGGRSSDTHIDRINAKNTNRPAMVETVARRDLERHADHAPKAHNSTAGSAK